MTSSMKEPPGTMLSSPGNANALVMGGEASEGDSMDNGETCPGHRSFHSGLSALLNAVTIQLTEKADEDDGHHATRPSSADASDTYYTDRYTSHIETNGSASSPTMTPAIVPESHLSVKGSFPGVLMTLLLNPQNAEVLTFLPDGKFFVIDLDQFSVKLMKKHFNVDTFDDFLSKLATAGFSRIDTDRDGIEVFRHPLFQKGEWEKCARLLNVEEIDGSKSCPPLPLPPSHHITSDLNRTTFRESAAKRRLSPNHAKKLESKPSPSYQKPRIHLGDVRSPNSDPPSSPDVESSGETSTPSQARTSPDGDCRDRAQSITAHKMSLEEVDSKETVLEEQAVVDATRTIVSDAIETLLRDEHHTRQTFLKHEETLSKSSIPGVVPIAKQLFSSKREDTPSTDSFGPEPPATLISPDTQTGVVPGPTIKETS